ncbi:MAG TPA: FAD-dependent oxidoreductase [Anaeromyxobacteraceae bacterium]|nr:FAD-dependent oxidoreductase [Anaeromyxobacteraceae bacterium]
MAKTILCACEDVIVEDVERAFHKGYRDLESVKRYTGLGTGPCQGKTCLALAARELLRLGGTPAEVAPFTVRPPLYATSLAALASLDPALLPLEAGAPLSPPPGEVPRPSAPVPERAKIVIVGGGIMGLGLAYNLCRRGVSDVVLLERAFLNAGASGRNGGGVRAQWTTPTMIRLAKRSLEIGDGFAAEMGINTWFRRGGYLFLAPTRVQAERIEKNAELHNRHGIPTRILSPVEALEVVPELDPHSFMAAAFNPEDAVVFPWPYVWGYASRAESLGARVLTFTRVTGFESSGGLLSAVITDRGRIACDVVVNAAGAWSREVAALAGVKLPNAPERHEIMVTEPLKPWLGPLVSVLGNGLYFSQSLRGEIVGGMGDPDEPKGINTRSTLRFLARFARAITSCVPVTAGLKVMRQWAGCYDVTPDNNPILGAAGFDNFFQLNGFVGHGFMMAPAVTELMAGWMAGDPPDEIFERFTLSRFERGEVRGEDFIIG